MHGRLSLVKQPMAATAKPLHHEGWVYEEKYDGWRMVAYKDADQVRLISRQGKGLHAPLPRAAAVIKALHFCTAILDGVTGVDEKLDGHLEAHTRPGASEKVSAAGMLWSP